MTYLRTITARVATTERRQESMSLLNEVLEALVKRDADRAESLMRTYVQRSARFALSVLAGSQNIAHSPKPNEQKTDGIRKTRP